MNEIKIYCDACGGKPQSFFVEPLKKDELNKTPWGDIVCDKCGFVIATLSADVEGDVALVMVTDL